MSQSNSYKNCWVQLDYLNRWLSRQYQRQSNNAQMEMIFVLVIHTQQYPGTRWRILKLLRDYGIIRSHPQCAHKTTSFNNLFIVVRLGSSYQIAHLRICSMPITITPKERLIRPSRPAYVFQFLLDVDTMHHNRIFWTRCRSWIYNRISTEANPILTYSIINSTARTKTRRFYPFPEPQHRRQSSANDPLYEFEHNGDRGVCWKAS